jgi:hypothetical protein
MVSAGCVANLGPSGGSTTQGCAVAGVDRNWHTDNLVTKRAAKAAAMLRELHQQGAYRLRGSHIVNSLYAPT